jgi:hypothetical protein
MSKELQAKGEAGASIYGKVNEGLLDSLSSAEAGDFEFAKLTVVQPTSKIPGQPGDIIDSNTNEKVIGIGESLSFVPLWFFKSFSVSTIKPRKWKRNETKVPANATRSLFDNRESEEDGDKVRWTERVNMYIVLSKDLDEALPTVYRLLFKPSSFKEIKKLLMDWEIKKKTGQYPFVFAWKITPVLEENEEGKYVVLQVTKDVQGGVQGQVKPEQFEGVKYWVETLVKNGDQIKKVESKLADDVEGEAAPTPGSIGY